LVWCISVVFLALPSRAGDADQAVGFREEAENAGVKFRHLSGGPAKDFIVESKGGGVAVLDYNGDGWLDIYLVSGTTFELHGQELSPGSAVPRNALFRNQGDGTFENVAKQSGTDHPGWGMGASSADYDNDGDADLYLANYGPDVLYRNQGDGTFEDVTAQAGIDVPSWSTGSAWGDYDLDGDLDLYVARYIDFERSAIPPKGSTRFCQYKGLAVQCGPRGLNALPDRLYRNEGNGTFKDVTEEALGSDLPRYYGFTPIWADFDRDGWPDLFVANDATPNLLFRNLGNGRFEELGAISGCAYSRDGREQSGMGADIADIDHDSRFDLFVANFSDDYNTMYRNVGEYFLEDVTADVGMIQVSWLMVTFGLKFLDYDLDGWKDAFVVNGHVYPDIDTWQMDTGYRQNPQLFRNRRDGTFEEVTRQAGQALLQKKVGRGAAFGDLDNDGDIDIVVNNLDDAPSLLICDSTGDHYWIAFELEGVKTNRDGIGAIIRLRAGDLEQIQQVYQAGGFLSGNDLRSHFGLGKHQVVDEVEIRWPSGQTQKFTNLKAGRFVKIREGKPSPEYLSY
jgi:hypothetical protein